MRVSRMTQCLITEGLKAEVLNLLLAAKGMRLPPS